MIKHRRNQCNVFLKSKVGEANLIEALNERTAHLSTGRHLLVIQNSTYIDLSNHRGRLKPGGGVGPIGSGHPYAFGFCLHPALVMDASLDTVPGFSSYRQWARDGDAGNRHNQEYKKLPIEQKVGV